MYPQATSLIFPLQREQQNKKSLFKNWSFPKRAAECIVVSGWVILSPFLIVLVSLTRKHLYAKAGNARHIHSQFQRHLTDVSGGPPQVCAQLPLSDYCWFKHRNHQRWRYTTASTSSLNCQGGKWQRPTWGAHFSSTLQPSDMSAMHCSERAVPALSHPLSCAAVTVGRSDAWKGRHNLRIYSKGL